MATFLHSQAYGTHDPTIWIKQAQLHGFNGVNGNLKLLCGFNFHQMCWIKLDENMKLGGGYLA